MNKTIEFLGYRVLELNFKMGKKLDNESISMNVNIEQKIDNVQKSEDGTTYSMIYDVEITSTEPEKGFYTSVRIEGFFKTKSDEPSMDDTEILLYPYVRSTVSMICVTANIPPLYLPMEVPAEKK